MIKLSIYWNFMKKLLNFLDLKKKKLTLYFKKLIKKKTGKISVADAGDLIDQFRNGINSPLTPPPPEHSFFR